MNNTPPQHQLHRLPNPPELTETLVLPIPAVSSVGNSQGIRVFAAEIEAARVRQLEITVRQAENSQKKPEKIFLELRLSACSYSAVVALCS